MDDKLLLKICKQTLVNLIGKQLELNRTELGVLNPAELRYKEGGAALAAFNDLTLSFINGSHLFSSLGALLLIRVEWRTEDYFKLLCRNP